MIKDSRKHPVTYDECISPGEWMRKYYKNPDPSKPKFKAGDEVYVIKKDIIPDPFELDTKYEILAVKGNSVKIKENTATWWYAESFDFWHNHPSQKNDCNLKSALLAYSNQNIEFRKLIKELQVENRRLKNPEEQPITSQEFYRLRLDKVILKKEDIIKALEDWGTISSMYEAKKYIQLVENIRRKLPLHLQNEILKPQ